MFTIKFYQPKIKLPSATYEREFDTFQDAVDWANDILNNSSIYSYYDLISPEINLKSN